MNPVASRRREDCAWAPTLFMLMSGILSPLIGRFLATRGRAGLSVQHVMLAGACMIGFVQTVGVPFQLLMVPLAGAIYQSTETYAAVFGLTIP